MLLQAQNPDLGWVWKLFPFPLGTYSSFGDDPRNVFNLGSHQSHFHVPWEIPSP